MTTEEVVGQQQVAQMPARSVREGNEVEVRRGTGGKTIVTETHIDRDRGVEKEEGGHIRAQDQDQDRPEGRYHGPRPTDRGEEVLHHTTNETREEESKHNNNINKLADVRKARHLLQKHAHVSHFLLRWWTFTKLLYPAPHPSCLRLAAMSLTARIAQARHA